MADNQTNRLSELVRNYNGEGPATSNLNMLAQGLRSRNKEPMNKLKPFSLQDFLDMSALATSPVPVVGDAVGLGADAYRYATDPSSRTPLNFGLTALSAIPFLPPLVSAGLGKFAQSQGKTLSAPSMTGPGRNQAGAIVYHGSPHKFDAFDSSKIGTGEGAQAYGHGLYFAENPDVAKGYKEKLSTGYVDGGGAGVHYGDAFNSAFSAAKSAGANHADHAKAIASQIQSWIDSGKKANTFLRYNEVPKEFEGAYKAAADAFSGLKQNPGSLYKVDLPDEAIAKMLDYDAPLSKQPEAVRGAIQNIDIPYGGFKESPKQVAEFNKSIPADTAVKYPDVSANQFYHDLVDRLGSARAASEYLRNLGIPGIKYFDAGSRGTAQGTRNYVTFPGNEGLLKILGRE